MKKTSKSPENTEVTPNKKKLKQARLPFMLLSDVSPKPETLPSRKRKLSVPDTEPATKVGKLCKENSLTEELVVISDEDSKGLPSPKKQDKLPNPYVKLVDAARKKKLQKSKGQKKAKTKSTKKQASDRSENQVKINKSDNNAIEDVEMIEVEAVVHHDDNKEHQEVDKESEESVNNVHNGDLVHQKDKHNQIDKETDKKSKNRKNVPKKISQKHSPKNKQKTKAENTKEIKTADISETICLEDSNNSADVTVPKATNNEKAPEPILPQDVDTKSEYETLSNQKTPKGSLVMIKRTSKRNLQKKDESPKKSTQEVTEDQSKIEIVNSEDNSKQSDNTSNEEEPDNSHKKEGKQLEQEDDSDIEMVDLETQPKDNDALKSTSEEPVTPKRSSRIKTKDSDTNLDASTCSMLNESLSSNPSTPRNDKSLNESLKNLTPKQMAKRLEAVKKREEREKEKQERDKKKQQEKEERAKQRQEKEDQKKKEREEKEEAKKKEREEKEEQKRKEKEEKEKQRELEKKVREEKEEAKKKEREEKEEQRKKEKEAREEERRKKQEALELEKQEQELKLKKTKEAFVSFFVPKQKVEKGTSSEKAPISKNSMLSSFTIKIDMRLAPTCRAELDVQRKDLLEKSIKDQDSDGNYLSFLKDGTAKPGSCGKTWPLGEKDDDVMIVEDELPPMEEAGAALACEAAPREKLRPKLLSFHENRRPPYWGTWRKKSTYVTPRRPFGQEKQLDYEVDSDDDWEDEADGESLDGSAGGSEDEAGNDDYEVDNEVFVPHGYLSDEEATMDEEDDNVLSLSPETQKVRLKHLEDEFESELKKPTEKLKPRLYGPLWETSEGKKPDNCIDALWNYFQKFAMIMDDVTPFLQPAPEPEKDTEKKKIKKKKVVAEGDANEQSPKSKKKKESKTESKEAKKPKQEAKKPLPNQPGINTFLKKVNST